MLQGLQAFNARSRRPRGGDQKVCAAVAEKCGLGLWVKDWGWSGSESREGVEVVSGEEIGERVRELMGDEGLAKSAARIRDEAMKAIGVGGSAYEALRGFVAKLRKPEEGEA